jgi:hypothetical protein
MIRKLLWPLWLFAILFFLDEELSLFSPWRGTTVQKEALSFTLLIAVLVLGFITAAIVLTGVFAIFLRGIGGGDVRRGWKLLRAKMAEQKAQRKST